VDGHDRVDGSGLGRGRHEISGGTGIAPFYQLLDYLLLHPRIDPPPKTRFTLLHGSLTPSELPPPSILGPLADLQRRHPERFSLQLFVDALPSGPPAYQVGRDSLPLSVRRIQPDDLANAVKPPTSTSFTPRRTIFSYLFPLPPEPPRRAPDKKVLFLVCGPEPMVEAFAGPRARDLTEGEIGGMLGEMGYGKGEVRKL